MRKNRMRAKAAPHDQAVKLASSMLFLFAVGVLINAVEGKWAFSGQPASSGHAVMNWVILVGLLYGSYALWRRAELHGSDVDERIHALIARGVAPGEAISEAVFRHGPDRFMQEQDERIWEEVALTVRGQFASGEVPGAQSRRISRIIDSLMRIALHIDTEHLDQEFVLNTAGIGGYAWRYAEEVKRTPTSFITDAANELVSKHPDPQALLESYLDLSAYATAFMQMRGISGLAEGSPGGAMSGLRFLYKAQEYIVTNLPNGSTVDLDDARACFLYGVALRDVERAAETLAA